MNPNIIIRDEVKGDFEAITEVTIAAFKTLDISNHTEHIIIKALRADGALSVSLVAELNGEIVGHIAFSPITLSDKTPDWYGIGPVSVLPEYHRQGIGTALIQKGLSRLQQLNAGGCCVVGHPDYYRKFGFKNPPSLLLEGIPPEVFFTLSFSGHLPAGTVNFNQAFTADGQRE